MTYTLIKVGDEVFFTDYDIYYLADVIDNADKNKLLKLKAHRIKDNKISSEKFIAFINVNKIIVISTVVEGGVKSD